MFDESTSAAWKLRYGEESPLLPDLDRFLNHRSVRRYSSQPIDEEVVRGLVACTQSAATSSNLQLWTAVSIQQPERRERMAMLCGNQDHIREAAWFFAFLADHRRLRRAAERAGELPEGLDFAEFFIMAVIDAALAAERLVCAAESLGIGICYIGALRNDVLGVQRELKLPPGVFGVFGLCLGWPEEGLEAEIKPRLKQAAVWHAETYNDDLDLAEYDERMGQFYDAQNMKGEFKWSARSGRRVDGSARSLTGREALKKWLEDQGFNRR